MPLFGKKKNDEASTSNVGAKNRADLGQMFDESVPESVRVQLHDNEAFQVSEGHYAILILDLDKYGFKDTKGKNTSQGEFIEYTKNSNIHAYIPATGYLDGDNSLGKEIVGIVPDATTLENLEEISLTREAEYYVAILDENLNTTITDKVMTLADAQAVIEDEKEISEFVDAVETPSGSDVADEDEDSEEEGIITSSYDDDDEVSDDSDDEIEEDDDVIEEDSYEDEYEDDESDNMSGESYDDSGDDEYDEYPADTEDTGDDFVDDIESMNGSESYDEDDEEDYDDDEIVDMPLPGATPQEMSYTEEQFNTAYSRKFYSEDLGITFNSEPFDAIFANRKPFKHLEDNRPEDGEHAWLNKQLNQQARDANTQLDTLHAENIQEMRARYMTTISRFCDDIVREVDPTNPNTEFYKMRESLNKQKDDLLRDADREIQKKKDELTKKFESDIKQVRERAANEAETSYRNKFGAQHERELVDTESHYRRDIEAACREAEQTIHEQRREAAKRKLDTAITGTLCQIENEYKEALRAYNELYQQFAKQIEDTYAKYRQEEIDRAHALAESLARNDEVAKVNAECSAAIARIKSEYEIKAQNNEDEKQKAIDAANERMEYMATQCKERVDDERRRVTELQTKIEDMSHDVKIEAERKDREYESRINELKQENKIWIGQYDTLDASYKRQHTIATILVVAIAIIALAVGFIVGMYSGLDKARQNTPEETRVVAEVNTAELGE